MLNSIANACLCAVIVGLALLALLCVVNLLDLMFKGKLKQKLSSIFKDDSPQLLLIYKRVIFSNLQHEE